MMWNAVVLAGDRDPTNGAARAGLTPYRAFAPLGDRRVVDYPLLALEEVMNAGRIGRIVVSAHEDAPDPNPGPWDRIPAKDSAAASVWAAYQAVGAPLLIIRAEAVMLSAAMILEFLEQAEEGEELIASLAPYEEAPAADDAEAPRPIKLREGPFLPGPLFAIATVEAKGAVEAWARRERKLRDPLGALGVGMALKSRFIRPSIAEIEVAGARRLGRPAKLARLTDPQAGYALRGAVDLIWLRKLLEDMAEAA